MHHLQNLWVKEMKNKYSECFKNVRVLDVGSLDVNGNNRQFFEDSEYVGLDVAPGPNVDVVSKCHEYFPDKLFDTVISTSALEHDMYREKSLIHMYELLKPGGWLFIVACHTWATHGTQGHSPGMSGTAKMEKDGWCNYYDNVTEKHFADVFGPDYEKFWKYSGVDLSHRGKDIRFVGEKIGIDVGHKNKDIRFVGHKKINQRPNGAREQFNKAQRRNNVRNLNNK